MDERGAGVWQSSAVAAAYLEGVRGAIPLAGELLDTMLRLIEASGAPVRRFLDLGCGDGVLAAAILRRYPDAEAVLADFSAPVLDVARKRFAAGKSAVKVRCADYSDPSWMADHGVSGPFDAVVSGYSIHHQPDSRKLGIYGEIFQALSPGGVFVNIEHVASPSRWVEAASDDLFIGHLHRYQAEKSRGEVAAAYHDRPDKAANLLASVEVQCGWLRAIGFTDVDCYLKVFELAVFGGRKPAVGLSL
jgi:tRNA (cmo5U34)-methyltransferase